MPSLACTLDNESVAGEYVVTELDAFLAVMKGGTVVDAVAPGDVIRVGILGLGAETVDIDVAAGGSVSVA